VPARIEEVEELNMRFGSRFRRWIGVALLGFVAAVLLSACDNSPSMMNPAGPIAETERGMAWLVFGIAAVVFVGVTSVLMYSVFRFRARPDSPEPQQVHGNTPIELIWTITPTVILFILLAITVSTMFALGKPNDPNQVTVTAIGHQWWWEFQYPNPSNPSQMLVTADEMHMPVNTVVQINLVSDNVIHSLWVPQLGGKTDVIPGHNNTMWLKATQTGNFRGECTEYCGAQHAHMDFIVIAQSSSDYQTWLAGLANPAAAPPTGSQEEAGLAVFKQNGCAACHTINGVQGAEIGKIGPNLTHFGSRQLIAGGVLDNNTANLGDWILHAQTVKPAVDMPSFDGSPGSQGNISQTDLNNLVAYLQSLK
jgi:cytochrome c oxidase subunit II